MPSTRLLLAVFCLINGLYSPLVAETIFLSARSMGMGAVVTVLDDAATACAGIAALPEQTSASVGIGYHNGFGIREIAVREAFAIVPYRPRGAPVRWVAAIRMQHFGYPLYHETELGLAWACRLLPKMPAGIRWDMAHAGSDEGRNTWHLSGALALQWHPAETLVFGFLASRLTLDDRTVLPQNCRHVRYRIGCGYRLSGQTLCVAEWCRYDERVRRGTCHAGFEYQPSNLLTLRCGIVCDETAAFSLGCTFRHAGWRLDMASMSHNYLGQHISFTLCKAW